ncbi:unnamed protein product [Acanthoscelides obtectus]|uniref:Uncharacterized protein n=1 Tax=Acanthoscelides obtectus TaxID=200917 RepID=A0A9P0KP55_ACAOB|nr:unnamed protein product [Acanthoscelides obtectus]CAK1647379.1 hypothetical protein AOBTE_LOCUS15203 [Acanthoscelides obtectus]
MLARLYELKEEKLFSSKLKQPSLFLVINKLCFFRLLFFSNIRIKHSSSSSNKRRVKTVSSSISEQVKRSHSTDTDDSVRRVLLMTRNNIIWVVPGSILGPAKCTISELVCGSEKSNISGVANDM